MADDKEQKLQDIASRFVQETIKLPTLVTLRKRDAVTGRMPGKKSTRIKQVSAPAVVCAAADFDELVQTEFKFPENRQYSVRLDLWSALQEKFDHLFEVKAEIHPATRPFIDTFRRGGMTIGVVRYLLDYFKTKGLVPVGNFVIRFPEEARKKAE